MNKIELNNKTILITGSSGFIGSFLCKRLLNEYNNIKIIGLDNMNNYIKEIWMGEEITNSPLAFDKYLSKLSKLDEDIKTGKVDKREGFANFILGL